MAGEVVIQDGASGWVSVATGLSLSAATLTQVHATNTIASMMAAVEEDYPTFDIKISVTTGTPAENEQMQVHLRPKADGTAESVAPSGSFQPHFLGSVTLDNSAPTANYYAFGLSNKDKFGTLYLKTATAITISVSIRMRSHNAAA